jgi:iron complex outermembrane recepter protein
VAFLFWKEIFMQRKMILLKAVVLVVMCCYPVLADETVTLEEIVVTGKKIVSPTKQADETVYTGSKITRDGIDSVGTKAAASVYEAASVLPGVDVESADPFSLAAEQKNIRIRGVKGWFNAMTVDGVPNWGYNPIGPRDYLYDMENIESLSLYKGAVPADLGTGVGARGGVMDLTPRWPEESIGADIKQSLGGNEYTRTFLRFDSGTLLDVDTRLAFFGSYTDAEKWKGPGDLGPRKNGGIMVSQPIGGEDEIRIWFNVNDLEQDRYKPLSYTEVRELSANYKNDFNASLTGIAAQDINYYKYNRADHANRDVLATIPITFSDAFQLNFKPYYSKEDTEIFQGTTLPNGKHFIQKRIRDLERYGMLTQFKMRFSWAKASLGYAYESSDMIVRTANYNVTTQAFSGYGMYTENDGDGVNHSPYFKLAGTFGALDWQAGLKYFYYEAPPTQGYVSPGPTFNLVKKPDLYVEGKSYDEFLPSIGLNYKISEGFDIYTSYGRNQMRPYAYIPIMSGYNSKRSAFQAAGVTLNDLLEGYDMEISDNIELGFRYHSEKMEFRPTIFYAKHKNLLTTVHDPRIGAIGADYFQNIGEATGYGMELEANFFLGNHISFFFNPSHTSFTYDERLTYAGATLDTKDKQVVDTPEWMIKSGLIFTYGDFEFVPMLRYIGKRYGDAENKEKIDGYTVADLKIGYNKKLHSVVDTLNISLELTNLFDKEYISLIDAVDDYLAGKRSYYVGGPFTALMSVSLKF